MRWKKMTIDRLAEYEKINGSNLVKCGNVWWREIRFLFYRPLNPFEILDSSGSNDCLPRLRLGYQHAVRDCHFANSCMNLLIFNNISEYSLKSLRHKRRNQIKRAEKHISIRLAERNINFIQNAYQVYLDFYSRTRYKFFSKRRIREKFVIWLEDVFKYDEIVIHGAYLGNLLCAVNISYLVNNILFDASFFSSHEGLKFGSADMMWHIIRSDASTMAGDIKYIYEGGVTGKRSLDQSKIIRGCQILKIPTYLSMNKMIFRFFRVIAPNRFKKLTGIDCGGGF